jgi:hypothetical protein
MEGITLTPAAITALRNVIDYNWTDEERDYVEQSDEGKTYHIFNDLRLLNALLNVSD